MGRRPEAADIEREREDDHVERQVGDVELRDSGNEQDDHNEREAGEIERQEEDNTQELDHNGMSGLTKGQTLWTSRHHHIARLDIWRQAGISAHPCPYLQVMGHGLGALPPASILKRVGVMTGSQEVDASSCSKSAKSEKTGRHL
eukprot:6484235-Amphidinium_carterae.1